MKKVIFIRLIPIVLIFEESEIHKGIEKKLFLIEFYHSAMKNLIEN